MSKFELREERVIKTLCRFSEIITAGSGGIIRVRSRSHLHGKCAAAIFLQKTLSDLGFYPITNEDFFDASDMQDNGVLWMDTASIFHLKLRDSQSRWVLATEGLQHIVVSGTIDSFIMKLFSLIMKRTFIWIISTGPLFPCDNVINFDLCDADSPSALSQGGDSKEYKFYESRCDFISEKAFELLYASSIRCSSFLTQAQCIATIAFFAAGHGKDMLRVHGKPGVKSFKTKSANVKTGAYGDQFNTRIVTKQVLLLAYRTVVKIFYAEYVTRKHYPFNEKLIEDNEALGLNMQPSHLDIEVLCQLGYIRLMDTRKFWTDYDYIEIHQNPKAKYQTFISFQLLKYCCKCIAISEAAFV